MARTIHDVILDPELHSEAEIQERLEYYATFMPRIMNLGNEYTLGDFLTHPSLSPELLTQLFNEGDGIEDIVRHPNFPMEQLRELLVACGATYNEPEVLEHLSILPEWHQALLPCLNEQPNHLPFDLSQQNILRNPSIPPQVLHAFAHSSDKNTKFIVAQNRSILPQTAELLLANTSTSTEILRNPRLPGEALTRVIRKQDISLPILSSAVKNPALQPDQLLMAAESSLADWNVLAKVLHHRNTTQEVFDTIMQGEKIREIGCLSVVLDITDHPMAQQHLPQLLKDVKKYMKRGALLSVASHVTEAEIHQVVTTARMFQDSLTALRNPVANERTIRAAYDRWAQMLLDNREGRAASLRENFTKTIVQHPSLPDDVYDRLMSDFGTEILALNTVVRSDTKELLQLLPCFTLTTLHQTAHYPNVPRSIIRLAAHNLQAQTDHYAYKLAQIMDIRKKYRV